MAGEMAIEFDIKSRFTMDPKLLKKILTEMYGEEATSEVFAILKEHTLPRDWLRNLQCGTIHFDLRGIDCVGKCKNGGTCTTKVSTKPPYKVSCICNQK
ncbi:Hypothetical protein Nlim_0999 [Candidatus Nitrosarchaeum limnium SFB1]|jgi:hypothetical protein|uniref:Uncharacterized protein n=1 Tax=Candidatus Nitrosarchaeum limnium SFB1 TaxID=886738 RepID=F3KKI1_9ARCH|nr:Hypothetical protein Nlim_0999 [Candidatus Nitrosarchaeum limnium SFB1]